MHCSSQEGLYPLEETLVPCFLSRSEAQSLIDSISGKARPETILVLRVLCVP